MMNQKKLKINANRCRACYGELLHNPLLIYKNSPKSAQNFIENLSDTRDTPVTIEIFQCSKCG